MRRAKIIATIGPATRAPEKLRALISSGMDVARLNMSHGSLEDHEAAISAIRRLSSEMGRPVAILMDLAGPKIRTGRLKKGVVALADGHRLVLASQGVKGDASRISVNYPSLAQEVSPGDRLLLSDGSIELKVLGTGEEGVVTEVVRGGTLAENQGVNLPGSRLSVDSVTEKDLSDLQFGIAHEVDLVAQSFVRSARDCRRARDAMERLGGRARLIAKIEKPEAVEDIAAILDEVDGVMVARGDLAVETLPELVPLFQKKIISEALKKQKTVITATQMLQSMIENPRPTRAEASDVANATIDGSDALMLSGETAIGRFPAEAVAMMVRIIRSTEEFGPWPGGLFTSDEESSMDLAGASRLLALGMLLRRQSGSSARALAEAAAYAAEEIDCRLIVAFTQSGHMARCIAALRPRQRIVALTPRRETSLQLALSWGVEAHLLGDWESGRQNPIESADRILLGRGIAEEGEDIVLISGCSEDAVISNSMKLHKVREMRSGPGAAGSR